MDATSFNRLGPAAAFVAALLVCPAVPAAWAGGAGHGGVVMRMGGGLSGWHGGGLRPMGGMAARPGARGLPPVSGVIHERPGMRPYLSSYGHTNTAARFPGSGRVAAGSYGHVATGIGSARGAYGAGGLAGRGFAPGGYGHTATGLRGFASAGPGVARFGRNRALSERFRLARAGGRFIGGFGGAGLGYGSAGGFGLAAPDVGWSDYGGGYGGGASYGAEGTYGGSSTDTQVGSYGGTYRSETPLAASFAEPPLAPSPGSGYDNANRYAYAASDDVPSAARIVSVNRAARRGCDCGPRTHADPVIYRHGVGTAY